MSPSESSSEPARNDQPAVVPSGDADRQSRAVEAMIASIERLDELGLDGVEPAAAFLWS